MGRRVLILAAFAMSGAPSSAPSPAPSTTTTSATSSNSTNTPAPTPAAPSYEIALLSAKGYESEYGGYHFVEGQVQNLTDKAIENITAVGIWLDKDGEFIKSDDALIDYNPLLPGQKSPFKTISSGNPAMQKYRVEFKTLFGGALSVDDRRKKKK